MKRRALEWWFLLVALWPALDVMSVGGEALAFRTIVGRWPIPSVDDPSQQPFLLLHPVTSFLGAALPAVILFMLFLMARQGRLFLKPGRHQAAFVVFCLGLAAQVLIPPRIWAWFGD